MDRRILHRTCWGRTSRRAALWVGALALCAACGDPTSSESLLEALPYDAMGTGQLVFERRTDVSGLYLADGASRTGRILLSDGLIRGAVLSPNGKRLGYTRVYSRPGFLSEFDLAVRDLKTGVETRLTQDTINQGMPTWAPNGEELVYPSNEVYDYDYWQTSATAIGAPARRNRTQFRISNPIRCPYGEYAVPAVLSVGDELAWLCLGRVYTKSAGADASLLDLGPQSGGLEAVAWSPDGQRLAYSAFIGDRIVVRVVLRDGSGSTAIASVPATSSGLGFKNQSLCWTGDGSRLFFNATRGRESSHIWVVLSDGSGLVQLTSRPGAFDHNVSCT